MTYKLSSLISHQFITSGSRIELPLLNKDYLILIEALDELNIVYKNQIEPIPKMAFVIGSGFQIINNSNEMSAFRGIILSVGKKMDFLKLPISIFGHTHHQYFRIREIIEYNITSNEDISIVETMLNEFFNTYSFEKEDDLCEINSSKLTGRIDPRLLSVNRYIRNNYGEQITLQHLADLIGCNPVYLSNMYSKVFKVPPMKFLQNVRMQKAKELISTTSLSITEITQKLGYISNSQFGALFKKYHRVTPYQCRVTYKMTNLSK